MIEVTISTHEDYKLLGELARFTPKIPLQTQILVKTDNGVRCVFATYQIAGLENEDAMYIMLKYNGRSVTK